MPPYKELGRIGTFYPAFQIIDWKPVGLFKPEDGSIFAVDGPKKPMVEDAVYMRCKSKYIGDKEADAAPSDLTFTYFGGNGDGYVEKKFFPYGGKAAQPNYQSPIVALKVNGLEVRTFISPLLSQ